MRKQRQQKERRECWLLFGVLQPLLMILLVMLGDNDPNSLFCCAGLLLAVTFGLSFPFLLLCEWEYQAGYGWGE